MVTPSSVGNGTPTSPSIPSVTDRHAMAIWNNTCAMHSETIAKAAPERRGGTKAGAHAGAGEAGGDEADRKRDGENDELGHEQRGQEVARDLACEIAGSIAAESEAG